MGVRLTCDGQWLAHEGVIMGMYSSPPLEHVKDMSIWSLAKRVPIQYAFLSKVHRNTNPMNI